MSIWFCESLTPNLELCSRVKETLHTEKTGPQGLTVLDTHEFGPALVLDGVLRTTMRDEFIYHEMLTHVPLYTHSHPEDILIIGGGDGGSIREVLKHPEVKSIRLVGVEEGLVAASKKYLPALGDYLSDPRVEIIYEDGAKYLQGLEDQCDAIIVDLPHPQGQAGGCCGREFYQNLFTALKRDGLFAVPLGSPFFHKDNILKTHGDIKAAFPIARPYLAFIPTYPGGVRGFILASKDYDPLSTLAQKTPIPTRYYTCRLHRSAFVLPRFLEEMLG